MCHGGGRKKLYTENRNVFPVVKLRDLTVVCGVVRVEKHGWQTAAGGQRVEEWRMDSTRKGAWKGAWMGGTGH